MRMLHRRARVERVSGRLIACAAVAALYVLLSCGSAYPDDAVTLPAEAVLTGDTLSAVYGIPVTVERSPTEKKRRA